MIIIYNMKKGGISNTRDRIKAEILDKQQRINDIDKKIAQIQKKVWIYLSSEDEESKRKLERDRITLQTKINNLERELSDLPSYLGGRKTIKRKKSKKSKTSKKYFFQY